MMQMEESEEQNESSQMIPTPPANVDCDPEVIF